MKTIVVTSQQVLWLPHRKVRFSLEIISHFSFLAVADRYNRQSYTYPRANGAPGGLLDETFCPRAQTTELLLQKAMHARVIYVRGTPACGKSTLANLLYRHMLQTHQYLKVYSFTWMQTDLAWFEYLNKQCGISFLGSEGWYSMKEILIIIDEVQGSFNDTGLWADLIKSIAERRPTASPMIVLFGAYGSPLQGPRGAITSMAFAPEQRFSLRSNFQFAPSRK